jgi:hypothetical protein
MRVERWERKVLLGGEPAQWSWALPEWSTFSRQLGARLTNPIPQIHTSKIGVIINS